MIVLHLDKGVDLTPEDGHKDKKDCGIGDLTGGEETIGFEIVKVNNPLF